MKALLVAVLLAGIAGAASAEPLCGGPLTDQPALDRFGDIPVGAERTGGLAKQVGPCEESCEFIDRHGVRYVVAESVERKTLDFTENPKAVGPLGLSGRDTLKTAFDRLAQVGGVRRTLHATDDRRAIVTHYCFRNGVGAEFGLELHFESGLLARYETYTLSPHL